MSAPARYGPDEPLAVVGDRLLSGLADVTSDLAALESSGSWAVLLPFAILAEACAMRPDAGA